MSSWNVRGAGPIFMRQPKASERKGPRVYRLARRISGKCGPPQDSERPLVLVATIHENGTSGADALEKGSSRGREKQGSAHCAERDLPRMANPRLSARGRMP